jgi:2'-hydroxyisoflavone reductase
MRLLVLGGTRFLGRGVVQAALAAGDEVTTFTRGESGAPPDGVEALHGDRHRADGLAALAGRDWDAVVDTCGYVPRAVGEAARLLADHAGHYVFVSSMNAYPGWPAEPVTAGSPVHACAPDAGSADGTFEPAQYGEYKAGSERAVDEFFAGRSTHVRAGQIVGPHDNSGRLPWWVKRIGRGGEVLAPGDPARTMRFVDARDLGAWCVHCARDGVTGAFPATGPDGQSSYGELFEACRQATNSDARFTWVPDSFLTEHEVGVWTELPIWAPAAENPGLWEQDTSAAEQAGLRCRPVAETIADTAAWLAEVGDPPLESSFFRRTPGMDPAREADLLAAWHARSPQQT